MRRPRSLFAALGLALGVGACSSSRPPPDLWGLWSAGDAACAAGVGVRFGADAISAVYDEQRETLFDNPQYDVEGTGDRFRVRIRYDLPRRPGGAYVTGAHGVVVLERSAQGGLQVATHNFTDARTGAVRVRVTEDPAAAALTLKPCGDHPWRESLRGRS